MDGDPRFRFQFVRWSSTGPLRFVVCRLEPRPWKAKASEAGGGSHPAGPGPSPASISPKSLALSS
jgi:hypothetical protein